MKKACKPAQLTMKELLMDKNSMFPFGFGTICFPYIYPKKSIAEKIPDTVVTREPDPQEFFRTRPGMNNFCQTMIIEFGKSKEQYLVSKDLYPQLADHLTLVTFFTVINLRGVLTLWQNPDFPDDFDKDPLWSSIMTAYVMGRKNWIRILPNKDLGSYEVIVLSGVKTKPEWPDIARDELIKIAFKDHYIDDMNHPVIQQLSRKS